MDKVSLSLELVKPDGNKIKIILSRMTKDN